MQPYWLSNGVKYDTASEGGTCRESIAAIALSSPSPMGPGDRWCAFFFSIAMQDLISLQLQRWLCELLHWKDGQHHANWDTGEVSMRSPTFLQEDKQKKEKEKRQLSDETGAELV